MQDFVAIDFETANNVRSSVCSVGIVVVRHGEIVQKHYALIQPEPNYYCYHNTRVHGLPPKTQTTRKFSAKCGRKSRPSLAICLWWRTIAALTKVV